MRLSKVHNTHWCRKNLGFNRLSCCSQSFLLDLGRDYGFLLVGEVTLAGEPRSAVLTFSPLYLRTQKDIIEFELLLCDLDTDGLTGLLLVTLLLHGRLMPSGRGRLLASVFTLWRVLYMRVRLRSGIWKGRG